MQSSLHIPDSDITPPDVYLNRRNFLRAGIVTATTVTTGVVYRQLNRPGTVKIETGKLDGLVETSAEIDPVGNGFVVDDPMTPLQRVTNYNNFYEFTT
ncbi:MAG: hypothetical protein B7Z55_16405, partial [Planctomycetales bacterium 12-60-4]